MSPTPSFNRPLQTVDDAYIETSAGFVEQLTSRGHRRLAANLERGRTLRRVASEADLSETAAAPVALRPISAPDVLNISLTAAEARSRPGSRDFTFDGGLLPPPLIGVPMFGTSPTALIAELRDRPVSFAASRGIAPAVIPHVQVTAASDSSPETAEPDDFDTRIDSPAQIHDSSSYGAIEPESTDRSQADYTEAPSRPLSVLSSEAGRAAPSEESYYESARPPVPSKDSQYSTAASGASERSTSPVRYQLFDPDVPTPGPYAHTEHIATTPYHSMTYLTAVSDVSMNDSEYHSVPPPPISRSGTMTDRSIRSDIQEGAVTASIISEPGSDADLLADLERQSLIGSIAIGGGALQRRGATRSTAYETAYTSVYATTLESGPRATNYETARETWYGTAPLADSEHDTAHAAISTEQYVARFSCDLSHRSEYYHSAPSGEPPSDGPPSSISSASSVPSSHRIPRVPVPSGPPPSQPSSSDSGAPTSATSTVPLPGTGSRGTDFERLLVSLPFPCSR